MTSIRTVSSCAGLKRFIRYPFAKYRQHPHWVPPLLISEREKFDPKKNPFYEHARVDLFLAERSGEVVGRVAERVRKRYDPVVRPGSMKRFEEELAILKRIYNEDGERNWGFGRYTEAELDRLARELKLIIDPDVALFLELDGQVASVAIGLPDVNQVLKRMRGRLLPFGIFQFLDRKKIIDQERLPILGLMPEYRNKGLDLLLIHEIYKRGTAKGYKRGELSWVLEDNKAMNHAIEASGATLYKTYRMYQKAI
jgi:GNAT superfamily N-acetyltransferase